jgi:hypothetical protein
MAEGLVRLLVVGLHGVVACGVSLRGREIGVRMALGAEPGDVHWMILGRGLRVTALGIACGLSLIAATVRILLRAARAPGHPRVRDARINGKAPIETKG